MCNGTRHTTGNRIFRFLNEENIIIEPVYQKNSYKSSDKQKTYIQKNSKRVGKFNKDTGELIKIYDTIALAARENNCDASSITKVCKGKVKTAKGFKWKYV